MKCVYGLSNRLIESFADCLDLGCGSGYDMNVGSVWSSSSLVSTNCIADQTLSSNIGVCVKQQTGGGSGGSKCNRDNCPEYSSWYDGGSYELRYIYGCVESTDGSNSWCDEVGEQYRCATGYYGSPSEDWPHNGCKPCPEGAYGCGAGSSDFSCDEGYYRDGDKCISCKVATNNNFATSDPGATDITECYVDTFEDESGSGRHVLSHCFFQD